MQRDALIIGIVCVLALLVGGWFFLNEQTPASALQLKQSDSFVVVAHGTNAQWSDAKNFRIQNQEELKALWEMVYGTDAEVPTIDFSQYQVLAVFEGEKQTGGYDISVVSVTDSDTERSVVVQHTMPGEGCMSTQALTSPFEIVLVHASDAEIVRTDVTQTTSCN